MASVGSTIPTTLHFIVLCCASLLQAELVHIVTPQNTATTATTPITTVATTTTTTTITERLTHNKPANTDTYLKAYHDAQKLRSAPLNRNDYYDPPTNPPNEPNQHTYNTLIRSSPLTNDHYPSLTHQYLPVSPSPTPYDPSYSYSPTHSPTYPPPHFSHPHSHFHHHHHHDTSPPNTHSCHPTPYSSPSAPLLLGFLPKKLSLKVLLKILLKLVLFKMIVKFLAVICLLLFIPLLKSKETATATATSSASAAEDDMEDRRARQLDSMTGMIWESLEEKNWMYGDEEMKDMREIAEQADEDEEENSISGPLKAVKFLEFCVSTVDRVVGYILGVLQRQRNERGDLASFVLEKLSDFVKNF